MMERMTDGIQELTVTTCRISGQKTPLYTHCTQDTVRATQDTRPTGLIVTPLYTGASVSGVSLLHWN